ncbi:MAG TPA: hypothetical protein VMF50_11900 [Candidatus Binataceae bacterium]|nr:hypothetical protein [Candidatus Binataceae bacterium]
MIQSISRKLIVRRLGLTIGAAIVFPCMIGGCALFHHGGPASAPSPHTVDNAANTIPPGPEAKINISYSNPSDYLSSMVVTKYAAANTIATEPKGANRVASTVLFEGGVVVWQVDIDMSGLSILPGIGSKKPYIVRHVKYGEVPQGFQQTTPDSGPPEPLEPDHYYVFSVIRASGSTNYEAVKVEGDGSLIAYNADPRAGDSFQLCCNLTPDFTVTAAGSENSGSSFVTPDSDSSTIPDSWTPDSGGPDGGSPDTSIPDTGANPP